jgi:hypothetical protein
MYKKVHKNHRKLFASNNFFIEIISDVNKNSICKKKEIKINQTIGESESFFGTCFSL